MEVSTPGAVVKRRLLCSHPAAEDPAAEKHIHTAVVVEAEEPKNYSSAEDSQMQPRPAFPVVNICAQCDALAPARTQCDIATLLT